MFFSHKRFCCQLGKKMGWGPKVQKKIKIKGQKCLILK
jgi:hypothetical protein